MDKYSLSNLVIECTRKCNMNCDHCLRGEPQNTDLNLEYVETLFQQIDSISHLTLTGGEVSLVPDILIKILDIAKKYRVSINSYFIVTNAKKVTDKFLRSLLDWYLYCDLDDSNICVEISDDQFHEDVDRENIEKLKAFRFVQTRYNKDFSYDGGRGLIKEGRAVENFNCTRIEEPSYIYIEDNLFDGIIYLNCKGDILTNCDLSYETQDRGDFRIGNIMDKDFNFMKAIETYNERIKT